MSIRVDPVVFGVNTAGGGARLDIQSTMDGVVYKGFLPPRVTTTQKNSISSPAAGLMVYDTDLGKLCFYDGGAWRTVTST